MNNKIYLIKTLLLSLCGAAVLNAHPVPSVFSTFNNGDCNLGLPLPDEICQDFSVLVNGVGGTLGSDVYLEEIRFYIEHSWDADLDIYLTSPQGQIVELTTDNGSAGDNYGTSCTAFTTLISDLKAGECDRVSITEGFAPFTGVYLPEQNLSNFDAGSPDGTWILNICDDAAFSEGTLQYFEMIFAPYACTVPNFISAAAVDSTSVTLDWQNGSGCLNTLVEYGPPGFTPGSGTSVNAGCPPFTLTGLQPVTEYDIYLRESCADGGFSAYSCPFSVVTLCSPPAATLLEDFDGQASCALDCTQTCDITGTWFNITGDETDWIVRQGPTPSNDTGPDADADDNPVGKYIYLETTCTGAFGWEAELYSHCITVIAEAGDCHMSFNYMMHGATVSEIKLHLTTDGQNWQQIWTTAGNQGQIWQRANLDLSEYDGETVQFRFTTRKIFGARGDTALDNIAFHGSVLAGEAGFTYYADADGDGYGLDNRTVQSCYDVPPPGYAEQGGDCNDFFSFINPGAVEFPCDGFDGNCDPDDDNLLPAPQTLGNSACSDETDTLYAAPAYFGQINWYDTPNGGSPLHTGDFYLPPVQTNTTSAAIEVTFYVEEVNEFGCISGERAAVTLTVLPTPFTQQTYAVAICAGEIIDLTAYPFIDEHQTDFTLTYHSSLPAVPENELTSPLVSPDENAVYFIKAATGEGCSAVIPLSVTVHSVPQPTISGSTTMCIGTTQILAVQNLGDDNAPYQYLWTNGAETASTQISAPVNPGESQIYTVFVTGSNGCTAETSITITAGGGLTSVSVQTTEVSVCNGSDGAITLQPTGGVAPYSYQWSGVTGGFSADNFGTFTIDNLPQGAYRITVTDSSGGGSCGTEIPLTVVNGPAAIVQVDSTRMISCFGMENGGIYLSAFGDAPAFQWSHGKTTEDVDSLAAGMYSVTVSDNGCQNILQDFIIQEPDSITAKPFAFSNVSCAEAADGEIEIIVIGGTPEYSIEWSNGDDDFALENLQAGTYNATVTDGNGCRYEDISYTVNAPPPVVTDLVQFQQISCAGETDGSLAIAVTGGTEPFIAEWNDGGTGLSRQNLGEGNYSVTVTDLNGCTSILEDITLADPLPLSITPFDNNPSCAGAEDGFLTAQVFGGTTPYDILWSNGVTSAANFNLGAGTYSVLITDARNCTLTDTFLLTAPVAVSADFMTEDASCFGGADGAISLESGSLAGNAPFEFVWSTGATGEDLENIPFGTYTVTVTDADNCAYADTVEVGAQQPISLTTNVSPPNCAGAATGQIMLNAFGGMPFYTYEWSNGMTGETIDNLTGGNYSVTITAADGCYRIEENIGVDEPPLIEFQVLGIDSVVCAGTATGQIELDVTGGVPPYDFTWNGNGAITEDLNNVPAGEYVLDVTDSNGCTVESPTFSVGEAAPLTVTDNVFVNEEIECETLIAADSVELIINGGQMPYQIHWDNGSSGSILYNAEPAEYTATVTDALGCTIIHTVKVQEDREALALIAQQQDNDCDNTNHAVCVEIIGGLAPYTYLWDDTQNGTTEENELCRFLSVGMHQLTVTDSYGCSYVLENILIQNTAPLNIYTGGDDVQNIDCRGAENGSITVTVTGGLPAYVFYWENAAGDSISSAPSLSGLDAGAYFLTVTDANGCQVADDWSLTEPATVITTNEVLVHNPCNGDSVGLIDLQVSGGAGGYTFEWTTGDDTEVVSGLPAGFYGVTITDADNCVRVIVPGLLEILEPATELTLTDSETDGISCFGDADGSISLEVSGGTPNYLYDWSNSTIGDTPYAENLTPGDYFCNIFDAQGCLLVTPTFTVEEVDELTAVIISSDESSMTAEIEVTGGTPFSGGGYLINWQNGDTGTIGTGLPEGVNTVTVEDANGCVISLDFILGQTAVENSLIFTAFNLAPNPTTGRFWIDLTMSETADIRLVVRDVLGREVVSVERKNYTTGRIELNLQDTPSGIYFTELSSGQKQSGVLRVVKE